MDFVNDSVLGHWLQFCRDYNYNIFEFEIQDIEVFTRPKIYYSKELLKNFGKDYVAIEKDLKPQDVVRFVHYNSPIPKDKFTENDLKLIVPSLPHYETQAKADLSDYDSFKENLNEANNPSDFEINGNVLFKYKGKSSHVIVPDNIIEIGIEAFDSCKSLKSIECQNVTKISDWAFYYCTKLKSINCPNVTTIGKEVFYKCTDLELVNCPNVIKINYNAFLGCKNLKSIDLPKITEIGADAFAFCHNNLTIRSDNDYVENYCEKRHINYEPLIYPGIKVKAHLDDYDSFEENLNQKQSITEDKISKQNEKNKREWEVYKEKSPNDVKFFMNDIEKKYGENIPCSLKQIQAIESIKDNVDIDNNDILRNASLYTDKSRKDSVVNLKYTAIILTMLNDNKEFNRYYPEMPVEEKEAFMKQIIDNNIIKPTFEIRKAVQDKDEIYRKYSKQFKFETNFDDENSINNIISELNKIISVAEGNNGGESNG